MGNSTRTFESKEQFLRSQYDGFKLQWMIDHDYTLEDLIRELGIYVQESDDAMSVRTTFEQWELNAGFGGAIWPCYQEWLECEGAELNG